MHLGCNIIHPDLTSVCTPDKDGYYTINGGMLGAHNRRGDYFIWDQTVENAFMRKSPMRQYLERGKLYSEFDHPSPAGYLSKEDYIERLIYIDMKNTTSFISDVYLDAVKTEEGNDARVVRVKTKPWGDKSDMIESALRDTRQNFALSMRGISDDRRCPSTGKLIRRFTTPITLDFVLDQGFANAEKFNTVLESLNGQGIEISAADLQRIIQRKEAKEKQVVSESSEHVDVVLTSLGWERAGNMEAASWLGWGQR